MERVSGKQFNAVEMRGKTALRPEKIGLILLGKDEQLFFIMAETLKAGDIIVGTIKREADNVWGGSEDV